MNKTYAHFTAKGGKPVMVNLDYVVGAMNDKERGPMLYVEGGQYFVLEDEYERIVSTVSAGRSIVRLHAARTRESMIAVSSKIMSVMDDDASDRSYVYLAGGKQYMCCSEDIDYIVNTMNGWDGSGAARR